MGQIIDISQFNNVTDFGKVKQNVEAVIIRLGYRACLTGKITTDLLFEKHLAGCKANAIPFSLYFVTTAINILEARQEAMFVANAAKKYMHEYPLPVFVDTETVKVNGCEGRSNGLEPSLRTCIIQEFCNTLQSQGVPAGIYAGANWLNNKLQMSRLPFSVWCADYSGALDYKGPYVLWQYTSTGEIDGIKGHVDISKRYSSNEVVPTPVQPSSTESDNIKSVLAVMSKEVGYLEKKSGDIKYLYSKTANAGSGNYTKYGAEMHAVYPKTMDYPAPWCDAWFDWCIYQVFGKRAPEVLRGQFDDYTINSAAYYKKAGAWTLTPKAGYQIFLNDSKGNICHTGAVMFVDTKFVYTYEGNTSGASGVVANGGGVAKKSYPLNYYRIAGYGIPNYNFVRSINTTNTTNTANTTNTTEPCNKDYAGIYSVIASSLNLRTGAGKSNPIIVAIPKGAKVTNYGFYMMDGEDVWLHVTFGKQVGYCSKKYLSK